MEPINTEFSDPRLVAIYDTVNPIAKYEAFYVKLAARLAAKSIIDIGCGTGLLTYALATHGHHMIGLEPAPAMLERAQQRLHDFDAQWINAAVDQLGDLQADLAIMTGHVAQFFLDDQSWQAALNAIHRALGPGGYIAFESRNPLVQAWANQDIEGHIDWPSHTARRVVHDPVARQVEWWVEVLEARGRRLRYEIHYLFTGSGETVVSPGELKFRTQAELSQSLAGAGFTIEHIYGDWDSRPASSITPEMIVVARRA